jgi:hypothetical protein
MAAHPDGRRLYVNCLDDRSVLCIDIDERDYVLARAPYPEPVAGLALFGDPPRLLIAMPKSDGSPPFGGRGAPGGKLGACAIYEASTFSGRASHPAQFKAIGQVLDLPDAAEVEKDPSGTSAWAGYRDGLASLDVAKDRPMTKIALGEPPASFRFETQGKRRIFVNLPKAAVIAVIDPLKGQVLDRWKVLDAKDNGPMALDENGKRLFVVSRKPAKVLAYDTDTGKAVAWTDSVADAGDIHFDGARRRIYITGDGAILVVSLEKDRFKLIDKIKVPIPSGARRSAWMPSSNRLCIGVPSKDGDSDVWVYRAQS